MTTGLGELLAAIAPERTLDDAERHAAEAMNCFPYPNVPARDYEDCKTLLIRFMHHVDRHILHLPTWWPGETDRDFDWSRCGQFLTRAYGQEGTKAAWEMIRTAQEGGIRSVYQELARQIAEEYAWNEIRGRVSHFWWNSSVEELMTACDEYIQRFRHVLPPESLEHNGARIRISFWKVLEEHPRLMQRLHRVGRS